MSNGDNRASLLAIVRGSQVPTETPDETDEEAKRNELLRIVRSGVPSFAGMPPEDIGIVGAFGAGIKEGFLMPLNIFGREGEDLTLDETGERVANFIGNFVGLGLGFYPFAAGSGVVLRGVGLTSKISPEVAQFLKFTLGGTAQAAGTAETVEEVPKAAAIGLAAGIAIDGFFLARAMRGRADDLGRVPNSVNNGSPIPDVPTSSGILGKEIELAPTDGKSASRLRREIQSLSDESKNYDKALVDLVEEHVETVRIPDVSSVTPLFSYVSGRFPNAQVLVRDVVGRRVREVLVHNPIETSGRMTETQITQWKATGAFENMSVIYRGKSGFVATGAPAAAGRMQIHSLERPHAVFAPLISDISNLLTPQVLTEASIRHGQMRNVLEEANEIGFTVLSRGSRGADAARRGTVNTTDFQTVSSLKKFVEDNRVALTQYVADSPDEALRLFARDRGIRGLLEVDNGVTRRVHVFDQNTVQFQREPPRVGLEFDNALFDLEQNILSFVPAWRNAVAGPLRKAGFAEKDVRNFLEIYGARESNRLAEAVMSKETQAMLRAARSQFLDGCL